MLSKTLDASYNDVNVSHQNELPSDSVSSIAWIPNTNYRMFATTSWDSKIRLYDTVVEKYSAKLTLKGGFEVEDPCLSIDWCDEDPTKLFGGCVNGTVKAFDINTGKYVSVGLHDSSVKNVYWLPKAQMLLSLSFDKTIRFWDLRQPEPAAAILLKYKVYCSDLLLPYLALGLSEEKIAFIDLANLEILQKKTLDYYDSPLGKDSQITTIAFNSDGSGFGVGANDGRANVTGFGTDSFGRLKLSTVVNFKTKKYDTSVPSSKQILYPVHDIGFSPLNKDFVFTAGGEGAINFWDFQKRDKISSYDFHGAPVTRSKMSPDGLLLAYSLGYDWSLGIQGYAKFSTKVCVHVMQENDYIKK